MINIGLTCREDFSIWSNGLDQNIYFIFNMINNIENPTNGQKEFYATLVSESPKSNLLVDQSVVRLTKKNIKSFDMIIEIACPLSDELTNYFNSLGKPIVTIKLGNNFMLDMTNIINEPLSEAKLGVLLPYRNREIWVSSHFYKFKDYINTNTYTEDVKIFPYIWSDDILRKQSFKIIKNNRTKIGIFEPNIDIVKTCLTPILICEKLYRENPELVTQVLCFNGLKLKENKKFVEFAKQLDIVKDGIISFEPRVPLFEVFRDDLCGTVVSNQFLNELNYLYFESTYFGAPLVHNSSFLKDFGYYYDQFDATEGAKQLKQAILSEEDHFYKNKKMFEEFSPENKKNMDAAYQLIKGALK